MDCRSINRRRNLGRAYRGQTAERLTIFAAKLIVMRRKSGRILLAGMAVAGVVSLGFVSLLRGQAAASVWDGIYTEDQARQGDPDYHRACGSCHGDSLEGKGQAPPLAGMEFTANWDGQTVGDLFEKIQTSMPADHPGQLTAEENAGILAYILQSNKFPAGKEKLAGDGEALRKIRFEAKPPH
jgi:mono/diheme cytochrome c family protein